MCNQRSTHYFFSLFFPFHMNSVKWPRFEPRDTPLCVQEAREDTFCWTNRSLYQWVTIIYDFILIKREIWSNSFNIPFINWWNIIYYHKYKLLWYAMRSVWKKPSYCQYNKNGLHGNIDVVWQLRRVDWNVHT